MSQDPSRPSGSFLDPATLNDASRRLQADAEKHKRVREALRQLEKLRQDPLPQGGALAAAVGDDEPIPYDTFKTADVHRGDGLGAKEASTRSTGPDPDGKKAPKLEDLLLERIISGGNLLGIFFFDLGKKASRPVARLRILTPENELGSGTGSLVSSRLLLTNHHVLRDSWWAERSEAIFDDELDEMGRGRTNVVFRLLPREFFLTDPALDYTLVAVAPWSQGDRPQPIKNWGFNRLGSSDGDILLGAPLNIVQHPNGQPKQVALQENRLIGLNDHWLQYETDTSPGSSGAPVFNNRWELVGLHHSGWPKRDAAGAILTRDGKIWEKEMGDGAIHWLGNEGLRVSALVAALVELKPTLVPEKAALLDELLEEVVEAPVPESAVPPAPRSLMSAGSATPSSSGGSEVGYQLSVPVSLPTAPGQSHVEIRFQLPVHLSLRLGQPLPDTPPQGAPPPAASVPAASFSDEDFFEAISIDTDYRNRQGYDPAFLGIDIPLPRLSPDQQTLAARNALAQPGEDPYLLKYHHFSLMLNRQRRLAFFTAVNIDGALTFKFTRKESGRDKWSVDPRVLRSEQSEEAHYRNPKIDRGHLVRREDPIWGATREEAKKANDDTFHFTNCSPQHSTFNQSAELWQGLENHVLKTARVQQQRLSVFTGPIFADNDQELDGIKVPGSFFKILVFRREDGSVSASAFLLDQKTLIDHLLEAFAPEFHQVPIAEVTRRTRLNFQYLEPLDTLPEPIAQARSYSREPLRHPIRNLNDMKI